MQSFLKTVLNTNKCFVKMCCCFSRVLKYWNSIKHLFTGHRLRYSISLFVLFALSLFHLKYPSKNSYT